MMLCRCFYRAPYLMTHTGVAKVLVDSNREKRRRRKREDSSSRFFVVYSFFLSSSGILLDYGVLEYSCSCVPSTLVVVVRSHCSSMLII